MLTLCEIASPMGPLVLATRGETTHALAFGDASAARGWIRSRLDGVECRWGAAPPVVAGALAAYFAGDLTAIDSLAVDPQGTPFQQRVWQALRTVPAGRTVSYGALAGTIGAATAVRAVGAANGANPIPIVIPCHRVIGTDRSLVGYGGGLDRKRWLLRHEGAAFRDREIQPRLSHL